MTVSTQAVFHGRREATVVIGKGGDNQVIYSYMPLVEKLNMWF